MSNIKFDKELDVGGGTVDYLKTPWSFEETVARIYSAAGYDIFDIDEYKTSFEVVGSFNGKGFRLYDYCEDREVHIGGEKEDLNVRDLTEALVKVLSEVEPTPYEAEEFYDYREGYEWPVKIKDYEIRQWLEEGWNVGKTDEVADVDAVEWFSKTYHEVKKVDDYVLFRSPRTK